VEATHHHLELTAIDGANPLGFLAAIGVLAELSKLDSRVRLGWRSASRWIPLLQCPESFSERFVTDVLTEKLRGSLVDDEAERRRQAAQDSFDRAKTALKDAEKELKERKLRGAERRAARTSAIEPFEQARNAARTQLLTALKQAVASPELALGQRPDCTIAEFREHAVSMRVNAHFADRKSIDLLASFGAEIAVTDDRRIAPTPFCFITGSGHQWFLDTARQLMAAVSQAKVREAIFELWAYCDEQLTMRWDPVDDRRYALMDRDPTASDNKSATVWMANLLAYRALTFFPCVSGRYGPLATGWTGNRGPSCFTWPLWNQPLGYDTIRSLLQHPAFGQNDLSEYRRELRLRGVRAIFRSYRIQVGNPPLHKINFTPSRGI
jgi:hypothetical protein